MSNLIRAMNMIRKTARGVTLIELVMAMVILTAVAIPMAAMIGAQIAGTVQSTDFTAAGNLARAQMEKLQNASYATVATGSVTASPYDLGWTVTTVSGAGGAERKDIVLTAKRTGTTDVLVTLYTSIAKDVTYAA